MLWALAALPAGLVGGRIGLRGALMLGFAMSATGNALILLVEALPPALWINWLFGAVGLAWTGAALVTVNSVPYAMSMASEQNRPYVFPVQQAVMALLSFTGSLVAGLLPGLVALWAGSSLADAAPYRTVLWLTPVTQGLCVLAFIWARPATLAKRSDEGTGDDKRPIGLFVLLGLIVLLGTASEGAVRAFFNVYLDTRLGVAPAQIGAIIGLGQLLPVAAILVTPRLLARWGATRTISVASLGTAVAMLPLAALPVWGAASLGFIGVMAALAVNAPARSIFSQQIVAPRWRTTSSAILTIGLALGWSSMSSVGGFLIATIGFSGLFLFSAILAALASALALGYYRLRSAVAVIAPGVGTG